MQLVDYIENLQSRGELCFSKTAALQELNYTELALDKAIAKLARKNKLVVLKPGFIHIIPAEYKTWGIVPPSWFIDPLMQYLEEPYYVGLLSAADHYGISHQKPQVYQVMVNNKYRNITKNRVKVMFHHNNLLNLIPTRRFQTKTGYVIVSSPEATALDLVKYYRKSGYLNNVATVLSELREEMDPAKLLELVRKNIYDLAIIQRFGFIMSLEEVEGKELVAKLVKLIAKSKPRFVQLNPSNKPTQDRTDPNWRIFINDQIEVD